MLTNKEKITNVFNLFLEWNINDVRKAAHFLPNTFEDFDREKIITIHPTYDGGAMIGSVILAMCSIQSVAQFSLEKTDGMQFVWFVNNCLRQIDNKYDGKEIYALRCSLIKNYALLTNVYEKDKISKKIGYVIINGGENLHESEFGKTLNIRKFIVDIQLAMQLFFVNVLLEKLENGYAQKIINYHDSQKIGPIKK